MPRCHYVPPWRMGTSPHEPVGFQKGRMSDPRPLGLSTLPFPHVCVVEASAGSGKTYELARRYLQLLISPHAGAPEPSLKSILAITFSNKASFEMKARILDFLKKIALDRFATQKEKEEMLSFLGVSESAARQKALLIMEELLKNFNFFQVQTIDSFVNAILSGCAFKLGLSAGFRIRTDYTDYLSFSFDRLLDRAQEDKKIFSLFENFLAQYLRLESRPGWFPRKDILEKMRILFSQSNIYGAPFYRSRTTTKEIDLLKKKAWAFVRELADGIPQGTHAAFRNSLFSFLERPQETFDISSLPKAFRKEVFPLNKGGLLDKKTERLWEAIRKASKEISEAESVFVFEPYIDIFRELSEDFRVLAHKDDVLFLEELNRQARGLFDEGGVTVPELYYRLAARIMHFLIDEFQDTSRLQWKNLDPMVVEALSCGGTLFYVGDKKQAIYRFRGGEVALFDSVRAVFSSFPVISRTLERNYRSREAIVSFCNECFSAQNLKRFLISRAEASKSSLDFTPAEEEEVLRVFAHAHQDVPDGHAGGYVRIESLEGKTQDERVDAAKARSMELLEQLSQRFDYQDIAFLVRENDDAETVTEWLIEHRIPVESEKTLNIRNNGSIKELVSFLMFLNSPIDDLSFASFATGEIFARVLGSPASVMRDFIFDVSCRKDRAHPVYLYREFREAFPREWQEFIEEFFKNVGFVPLYELVISVYKSFCVLENFPAQQGFFMKFLEVIKKREEEEPGLSAFLEYFLQAADEELYVHVAHTNSVRVQTIHKAKGLEFRVVILPFLEMSARVDSTVTTLEEDALVLRRVNEGYRAFSPSIEETYRKEYLKSFIDELNAVYVGLTRAAEELYLFIPQTCRRGKNLAMFLIPSEPKERGAFVAGVRSRPAREALVKNISLSRYADWIVNLREEFAQKASSEARQRRQRGEVLHYLLSFVGDLSKEDKKETLARACAFGRGKFPSFRAWDEALGLVNVFVEHKAVRSFFFCGGASVACEKEFVDFFGHTRRIDRLIVTETEVWVADFKSSKADQAAGQVAEYLRIIADIYPGKKRRGFLLYLDEREVEEVHG